VLHANGQAKRNGNGASKSLGQPVASATKAIVPDIES